MHPGGQPVPLRAQVSNTEADAVGKRVVPISRDGEELHGVVKCYVWVRRLLDILRTPEGDFSWSVGDALVFEVKESSVVAAGRLYPFYRHTRVRCSAWFRSRIHPAQLIGRRFISGRSRARHLRSEPSPRSLCTGPCK